MSISRAAAVLGTADSVDQIFTFLYRNWADAKLLQAKSKGTLQKVDALVRGKDLSACGVHWLQKG